MTPKLLTERLILREIKGNDIFGYSEILSDPETMNLFGGPILANDLENKDFVQRIRAERDKGISYFWAITFKQEKEFIGFIRLMSYNSSYFDASFSAMGDRRYDADFLKYFDRYNGWEIDYALIKSQPNKGLMSEAVGAVLDFSQSESLFPIYAKVNSISNIATVKVLNNNGFVEYMPNIVPELLEKYDVKTIVEKQLTGMTFKWEV